MSEAVSQPAGDINEIDLTAVEKILDEYTGSPGALIPVLQAIQAEYGYLPRQAIRRTSERLRIPESEIYGVATFYAQFRLQPRGRRMIRVCSGTACHVRGGKRVLNELCDVLGIEPGQTTPDMEYSLETVACLGACGLAPTMMIDDDTHARLTPQKVRKLLERGPQHDNEG